MTGVELDYISKLNNSWWLSKVLFVALLIGLVSVAVLMVSSSERRLALRKLPVLLLFAAGCFCAAGRYWALFPAEYDYADKLYVSESETADYTVTSYSGSIDLKENMSVDCDVGFSGSAQTDTLTVRLDTQLKLDTLSWEGQELSYTREGDYLTISLVDIPETEREDLTLHFSYHGRIAYLSDIDGYNILTARRFAALPASFPFLPLIDDGGEKSYDLTVTGSNTIISNLVPEDSGRHQVRISGTSDTLCLFMGYFTQITEGDTLVYRARYNRLTDYSQVYERSYLYWWVDPYTQEFISEAHEDKPVAFLIYDLYGVLDTPVVYQNFWILNFGYAVN